MSAELDEDGVLQVVIADQGHRMLPHRDSDGLGLGVPIMTTLSDRRPQVAAAMAAWLTANGW